MSVLMEASCACHHDGSAGEGCYKEVMGKYALRRELNTRPGHVTLTPDRAVGYVSPPTLAFASTRLRSSIQASSFNSFNPCVLTLTSDSSLTMYVYV